MEDLGFEWDERKNARNRRKHGISFENARLVFLDDYARLIPDPDHSINEDRFLLLGIAAGQEMVVVAHCYRRNGDVIRIISARRATRNERRTYEENLP